MPGNMFIPPQQRQQNPMMGLLTQLALMKVQHDWSMEEKQLQLEALKVEKTAAREEKKSEKRSELIQTGAELTNPTGPVSGAEAYKQPEGATYDPYYGQYVKPPPDAKPVLENGKVIGHVDRKGTLHYLPQEKNVRENSLIEQYTKSQEEFKAGKGPDPGPWDPWLIRNKQAGAVRMGTDEKIDLAEKNKVVDAKAFINTPAFVQKSSEVAASLVGRDEWTDAPVWKKEELTFKAADEAVKNTYKGDKVYFGEVEGVQGWFAIDNKTKKRKMIRQWGKQPQGGPIPNELVRSR